MVEYVSLGDFQTAVGFLLASTPERSIRYYRDALCTLALAVRADLPLVAPSQAACHCPSRSSVLLCTPADLCRLHAPEQCQRA